MCDLCDEHIHECQNCFWGEVEAKWYHPSCSKCKAKPGAMPSEWQPLGDKYCRKCGRQLVEDDKIKVNDETKVNSEGFETSAGLVTIREYNDGVAKGVQMLLGDEIVCMLDVYEPQNEEKVGEARVLVYKKGQDRPCECITVCSGH